MPSKSLPPDLNKCNSLESYLTQLDFWSELTSLDKKKQGMAVVLSLPNESEFGNDIQCKVLKSVLSQTDFTKRDDLFQQVKGVLDSVLSKKLATTETHDHDTKVEGVHHTECHGSCHDCHHAGDNNGSGGNGRGRGRWGMGRP